jgi:hypothetical protein
MPTVTLPDGTNYFIDSDDPEEIKRQTSKINKQKLSPGSSTLGDIGRGFIAGPISAVQGVATIPTTGIDLLFNTEVTDSVNDFFEAIKPEVEGTAGKTVQMVTQFGIPGIGVARALSGAGKVAQLAGIGAVDAAVTTDDVDTFVDMIFDKESDEERIKNLDGRRAAAERIKERFQVFAETSAFVYAAPKVVGGAIGLAGGGLDLAAPYFNALAKGLNNKTGGVAAADKADKNAWDWLRKKFTYGGKFEQTALNNTAISDVHQSTKTYASNLALGVGEEMDKISRTMLDALKGGKLNNDDALELVKAISSYRAPLLVVERQFPGLTGEKKQAMMEKIRTDSLKKIKSVEGSGNKIDYETLGVDFNNQISSVVLRNKNLFEQEQDLLMKLTDGRQSIPNMVLDDGFKKALKENRSMYGATLYRQIMDPDNFKPTPEVYDRAINKIKTVFELPNTPMGMNSAKQIFNDIKQVNNSTKKHETPELFLNNIKGSLLKGKTLKNLPEIREALGEITPFNYKEGSEWKQALTDEAVASTATISKIATIVGDIKSFDEIRLLNDNALTRGTKPFLKTEDDLKQLNIEPRIVLEDPKTGKNILGKLRDKLEIDGVDYFKFGDESGALKDTYAPKVFVDAVGGASKDFKQLMPDILKNTYKALLGLKTVGQYNKTLLSVGAHIRNNTSVPVMAMMNGNLGPSANFTKNFKQAFAGVWDPRKKTQYLEDIKEAREYGIDVGRGTQLQEIVDVGSYVIDDVALMKKLKSNGLTVQLQKALKPIEKVYTGSDNAARRVNWTGEQSKLANVIANSTDDAFIPVSSVKNFSNPDVAKLIKADKDMGAVVSVGDLKAAGDDVLDKFIKGESADIALNVTPTYSRVPELVKELKFIPVFGNFTAFPAEIFRNTGNTMQRAIKEIASSNPELQKVGMRRIASALTTTIGIPTGLVAAGKALTGADQEQIDAYKRSFAAPWEKTATMIPTETDAAGNITGFYNYSYTNPYDFLQRPVKAIFNAIADGNRNEASLMDIAANVTIDSVGEMANPFLSTSIGANALLEAREGKTATGKTIYNESDMLGDRFEKSLIHVFNAIAPTALPFTVQTDAEGTQFVPKDFATAAAALVTGEKNLISPKGKPIDVAETMVAAFTGIKVVKPQLERSLYYKAAESKRAIRETTNEFNRLLRSNSEKDAETFVKGYINTNEARYNSLRTLYTAIEDARTLGLSDYQISEQLKIAKVANRDQVMMGLFKPIEINPDVLAFARRGTENKVSQNVPMADIVSNQLDLTGQSLQGQFSAPSSSSSPVMPPIRTASQVLREEEMKKILGTP